MERDRLLLYCGMVVLLIVFAYIFMASWYKPGQDLSPFMIGVGGIILGYYWGSAKAYKPADTENKVDNLVTTSSTTQKTETVATVPPTVPVPLKPEPGPDPAKP
jgi:hypothetical protein